MRYLKTELFNFHSVLFWGNARSDVAGKRWRGTSVYRKAIKVETLKNVSIYWDIALLRDTVWKFLDFSVTQILREIKLIDFNFRRQICNFEFWPFWRLTNWDFFNMIKCRILPKPKFRDSKMVKIPVFELLELPNLIWSKKSEWQ